LFEPGRSLVACSGVFVTRVTDIKTLHDTRFVLVDASVSTFPRPFHHPGTPHRARVLGAPAGGGATVPSIVAGRTTFSRDIFGSYSLPAALDVGSLIAFEDAGAYCESMTSRFLGQRPAAIHVADA
jgi:diaminopimelate decarboxylase